MNPFKLDGIGPTSYERHDFGWELLMPSARDRPNSQENTQRPKRNRLHGPAHGANLMLVPNCIGRPQRRQRRGARLLRLHWPSDRVRGGVKFRFRGFWRAHPLPPPPTSKLSDHHPLRRTRLRPLQRWTHCAPACPFPNGSEGASSSGALRACHFTKQNARLARVRKLRHAAPARVVDSSNPSNLHELT